MLSAIMNVSLAAVPIRSPARDRWVTGRPGLKQRLVESMRWTPAAVCGNMRRDANP